MLKIKYINVFSVLVLIIYGHKGFAEGYGLSGCGLGSIVANELKWEKEGAIQIFAATTNGTAGSQTFGISMGTSNCGKSIIDNRQAEQKVFLEYNIAEVKKEAVLGQGDFIVTFANLMGCQGNIGTHAFLSVSQKDFDYLFYDNNIDAVLKRYQQKLARINDCAS